MSARTDKFMRRVDAELERLWTNQARLEFLTKQIRGWEARYNAFVASDGASEAVTDPSDPPTAYDFLETLTALNSKKLLLSTPANVKDQHSARR